VSLHGFGSNIASSENSRIAVWVSFAQDPALRSMPSSNRSFCNTGFKS
jgi:hypothetical protein